MRPSRGVARVEARRQSSWDWILGLGGRPWVSEGTGCLAAWGWAFPTGRGGLLPWVGSPLGQAWAGDLCSPSLSCCCEHCYPPLEEAGLHISLGEGEQPEPQDSPQIKGHLCHHVSPPSWSRARLRRTTRAIATPGESKASRRPRPEGGSPVPGNLETRPHQAAALPMGTAQQPPVQVWMATSLPSLIPACACLSPIPACSSAPTSLYLSP